MKVCKDYDQASAQYAKQSVVISKVLGDLSKSFSLEKPPLGLRPKKFAQSERLQEILAAMVRYAEDGKVIELAWLNELNDIVEDMHFQENNK